MLSGRGLRILVAASPLLAAPAPPLAAEHIVAVVSTVGSPHQPAGDRVARGAEAAARTINASGGVLGAQIRLRMVSEDCTHSRAEQVAGDLTERRPAVVIGHLCPSAALAAAAVYGRSGILFIATGARDPRLTSGGAGSLTFRLAGRDDRLAAQTAAFAVSRTNGKGVAIVADRTLQARTFADALGRQLRDRGAVIVASELIESGEKSYADVARRIRESGAGVVVLPGQPIEARILAADLRGAGVTSALIGTDVLAVPDIEPLARSEGGDLVLMLPWHGLEHRSGAPSRPRTLPALGVSSGEAVAIRAEAALQAWAGAVRLAGTAAAPQVADALRRATFPTAAGPVAFDAAGDARVPAYVAYAWGGTGWIEADRGASRGCAATSGGGMAPGVGRPATCE
jgi:branched-chain amino acid transport system substrate-binding protein